MSGFWLLSALLAGIGYAMYKQDRRGVAVAFYGASLVFMVLDLQ